jgi:hypothetical protein
VSVAAPGSGSVSFGEIRPLRAAPRNSIHGGLDLYSGVFVLCLPGCPGTTR